MLRGIALNRQETSDASRAIDGASGASGDNGGAAGESSNSAASVTVLSTPVCDFRNTFFVRLHNALVADSNDRIIFHVRSPTTPEPPAASGGHGSRGEEIDEGLSSLVPVSRNEWQTMFRNDRKGRGNRAREGLYQNRNVIPTWLGTNPSRA